MAPELSPFATSFSDSPRMASKVACNFTPSWKLLQSPQAQLLQQTKPRRIASGTFSKCGDLPETGSRHYGSVNRLGPKKHLKSSDKPRALAPHCHSGWLAPGLPVDTSRFLLSREETLQGARKPL